MLLSIPLPIIVISFPEILLYAIISLSINKYPVFPDPTEDPSNEVNIPALLTVNDVDVLVISEERIVGDVSLQKFTTFTLFELECIP